MLLTYRQEQERGPYDPPDEGPGARIAAMHRDVCQVSEDYVKRPLLLSAEYISFTKVQTFMNYNSLVRCQPLESVIH